MIFLSFFRFEILQQNILVKCKICTRTGTEYNDYSLAYTYHTLAVLGGLCLRLDGIYKILKVVLASLNALRPCIQCNGYNFALSKLYFMFWMLRNFAEAKVFEFKLKLTFTLF